MAEVVRKKRGDAGVPRETPRDVAALQWLTEQYGAPLDLVAELLGTTQARTYEVVARWIRAGWVRKGRPVIGPGWVWPTAATARRMLDREASVAEWAPRASTAAHTRAAAAIRLAWCRDELDNPAERQWISERELRQRTGYRARGERPGPVPDGVWIDPDGRHWLVEAAITRKGREGTYQHMRADEETVTEESWHGLLYFVTARTALDVRDAIQRLDTNHAVQIERIDTGRVKGWEWTENP